MPAVLSKYWKDTPRFNVLVLGDIHEGKSQLNDAMRDPAVDQPRPDILELGGDNDNANGTTKGCFTYVGKVINGRRIMISDTPGISDGTAFLDDDDAKSRTAAGAEECTAAGAGGLIALLQDRFRKESINLVLIVHPSNKTSVQLGGTLLNALIKLGLVAGKKEDVSKNIKVVFTKADLLESMPEARRNIHRKRLVDTVLPEYFEGLRDSGADAEPRCCFTYGVPWSDEDEVEEEEIAQRPDMETVDTRELDALIGQVIRARPEFAYGLQLPPGAENVLRDLGLAQIFRSQASIESWGRGYKAQTDRLAYLDGNNLEATGILNCHAERRRIAIHLKTATGAWADELRTRDTFLRTRMGKKGGPHSLDGLKEEFYDKRHIGDPDPKTGNYPHKKGITYLCPPGGRKGDIAWALYRKATVAELVGRSDKVYKDGFDGSKRVPFVADEDAPDEPAATTRPGSAAPSTSSATRSGGPSTPPPRRPTPARKQPPRGNGKAPAGAAEGAPRSHLYTPPRPVEVPLEVLEVRGKGRGHQYECKIEGGGKAWLPAKLLKEGYPQLVAAFNAAAAAAAAGGEEEDEEGEAEGEGAEARPAKKPKTPSSGI